MRKFCTIPLQYFTRRGVSSRSIQGDDPFGEKRSWEDPSAGIFSAWNDVNLEGFAAAANSEEVRRAHFGPAWSKLTTVGRVSTDKMKSGEAAAMPSSEELHQKELNYMRKIMEKNYDSYEAFVEMELGGGEEGGEEESTAAVVGKEKKTTTEAPTTVTFVDPEELAGEEEAPELPLPTFMQQDPLQQTTPITPTATPATTTREEGSARQPPPTVLPLLLQHLGPLHGSLLLPLQDPLQWGTEEILYFLREAEQFNYSKDSELECVMDETMEGAFRMGEVSGDMLLNVVTPPNLFRLLRRWHVRRGEYITALWKDCGLHYNNNNNDISPIQVQTFLTTVASSDEKKNRYTEKYISKLDEVIKSVTPTIIRETILLCFPYGGGGKNIY
ncbi:hypothetical protein AGDE_11517 [Angomonas deanei]|nr:hypothetical protein AGDE_11517 [Angomonas deanei]|eukprot:EPY26147.1 hypothetical protein AGDE_11517 [Angomonas deanei]